MSDLKPKPLTANAKLIAGAFDRKYSNEPQDVVNEAKNSILKQIKNGPNQQTKSADCGEDINKLKTTMESINKLCGEISDQLKSNK